ncbi:Serine/threonine-protein kinase SRK2H [Capsicum baccatum]|uniref:Serine/threonine-protein kinase SRK2H n=1 Tax=Capsicum baccatum TaxID=33114 RepID=A0A2G2VSE0_CAPBA|nr:Serine/threonine-protein kinase SRK2H [Capsicum baccatum]
MERYELVKDIGSENFGVARLMRHKETKVLVAMKYIERGHKDKLRNNYPNMLFICFVRCRWYRLQLILLLSWNKQLVENYLSASGMQEGSVTRRRSQVQALETSSSRNVRHLILKNTLLDGSAAPCLNICDFGYSKSSLLHSWPKSTAGTPAQIAPKVLSRREYDGKVVRKSLLLVAMYLYNWSLYDLLNLQENIEKQRPQEAEHLNDIGDDVGPSNADNPKIKTNKHVEMEGANVNHALSPVKVSQHAEMDDGDNAQSTALVGV